MTRSDRIARLRTSAVLHQRGEDVQWEEHTWTDTERGRSSITISADGVLFWRTYNEIHAEQVKRDGEAWMRTQGWRRP